MKLLQATPGTNKACPDAGKQMTIGDHPGGNAFLTFIIDYIHYRKRVTYGYVVNSGNTGRKLGSATSQQPPFRCLAFEKHNYEANISVQDKCRVGKSYVYYTKMQSLSRTNTTSSLEL